MNTKIINSEKIMQYIRENKLTKTEFCNLAKITIKSFNNVLAGDENIRINTIIKIAKVLNCTTFTELFR